MAIGDEEPEQAPPSVEFVNWEDLYGRAIDDNDAIIEGLAFRGRWTAIASPAKAGKSTILLALAVGAAQEGFVVAYLDAEMGRGDVLDRVEDWMKLQPADLVNLHYTDLPPKLDNVQGATALWHAVEAIQPDLVIIDGLNGVVNGAENDDTTWRDMYEWAIMPLKQRNVAIVSADNLGKSKDLGPRGSSVKLDKADAVLRLERTEEGCKLTATHRRTAAYPAEQEYTVRDASEVGPPMTVKRVGGGGAPHGTNRIVDILNKLDAPLDIGRRPARRLLNEHGHEGPSNADLGLMLKWRRDNATASLIHSLGGGPRTTQDHQDHPSQVVLDPQDHLQETPARGVVPAGVSTCSTPPAPGPEHAAEPATLEHEYEEPF